MFGSAHHTRKFIWANVNAVFMGKCEGKRPVGRSMCRSDDTLKIYFQKNRMRGSALD